jgi:hypothetical protein
MQIAAKKLQPLVVGKSEKAHCMKGMKHYLSNYKASKNAWVTGKTFRVTALVGKEDGLQNQNCSVVP